MLLDTDLPYLEPLLFWLRNDPVLKNEFTDKSFFMPHSHLVSATEEAMQKDCPAPRALWILPQDTLAVSSQSNCPSQGRHSFYIEIIVQCIRDTFQLSKGQDGEVHLTGQFMELAALRKLVKKSVLEFNRDWEKKHPIGRKFEKMAWVKDQMLYPTEESKFLATAIQFDVNIYP